jgi:hypothetical protein
MFTPSSLIPPVAKAGAPENEKAEKMQQADIKDRQRTRRPGCEWIELDLAI